MSLRDEAKKLATNHLRCGAGAFIEDNPDGLGDELVEALADPTVAATKVAEVLKIRGHAVSASAMQRHRRGACSCVAS